MPRRGRILATLASLALAAPPAAAQRAPSAADDRQAVADVVARVAYDADARDWAAVRALYADTVRVDYTSLVGGTAFTVSADAMIAGWREMLPGFERTQHVLGPIVVQLDGDRATARAHVRALHRIRGAQGGDDWIVGGHYTYRLARRGGRWLITDHTLGDAYQKGNLALPEQARRRAAAAGR